ncbi:unnamed protein product [Meloidogyne enterolobii]|uniref:Uncharacterized protein n=1 Tax=Meloidogyne enterolobii TaxID=390850 RepID=A0ACB0YGA9_MELEN
MEVEMVEAVVVAGSLVSLVVAVVVYLQRRNVPNQEIIGVDLMLEDTIGGHITEVEGLIIGVEDLTGGREDIWLLNTKEYINFYQFELIKLKIISF